MTSSADQQTKRPSIERIVRDFLEERKFPQKISKFGALRLVVIVKKELEERIPESSQNYNPHSVVKMIMAKEHYHPTPDGGYKRYGD